MSDAYTQPLEDHYSPKRQRKCLKDFGEKNQDSDYQSMPSPQLMQAPDSG